MHLSGIQFSGDIWQVRIWYIGRIYHWRCSQNLVFMMSLDAGQEVEYFSNLLEGVKIASVCPMMLDIKDPDYEKHNHLELVELLYEKITWRYVDGNIMHSDSWNDRKTA